MGLSTTLGLYLSVSLSRYHKKTLRMRPRPVELLNKAMVWGDTEMVFSCWWLLAVWIGFPRPGLIGCQANEHPGHIYGRPRAQETPDDRALNPHCLTHVVIPSHLEKREPPPRSDRSNRQRELWSAEQESRCFLFPGRASRTVEVGKPSSPLRAVEAPSCLGSVADLWTSIRCHGRTCNTPSPSSSWRSSLLFAFLFVFKLHDTFWYLIISFVVIILTITIIFNAAFNQGQPTWLRHNGLFTTRVSAVHCEVQGTLDQKSISSRSNLPVMTAKSVIQDSIERRASSIRCHPSKIASQDPHALHQRDHIM